MLESDLTWTEYSTMQLKFYNINFFHIFCTILSTFIFQFDGTHFVQPATFALSLLVAWMMNRPTQQRKQNCCTVWFPAKETKTCLQNYSSDDKKKNLINKFWSKLQVSHKILWSLLRALKRERKGKKLLHKDSVNIYVDTLCVLNSAFAVQLYSSLYYKL